MNSFTPADWIELVKTVFFGLALLAVPAASFIASLRNSAKIHAVSVNVDRLEKNTNSISERNQAIAQKLGVTEGIAQERASVQANTVLAPAVLPLPVSDEKTAAAVALVVDAIHDTANAAKKD